MIPINIYNVISNDSFFGMGEAGLIDRVIGEIQQANKDNDDIVVRISSPGGSVFQGQAIITHLKEFPNKINMIVDGLAASMAGMILSFADIAVADEHSRIMLHKVYGGNGSEESRKLVDSLNKQFANIFIANSSQKISNSDLSADEKQEKTNAIIDLMNKIFLDNENNKDYWFTAEEAKEFGLIDKVTTDGALSLAANSKDIIAEYYELFGDIKNKQLIEEEKMGIFNNAEEINNLTEELDSFKKQMTEKENEFEELKNQLTDLEKENKDLSEKINAFNENNESDEAGNDINADEIKSLKESIKADAKKTADAIKAIGDTVKELAKSMDDLVDKISKTVTDFKVTKPSEESSAIKADMHNYSFQAQINKTVNEANAAKTEKKKS